MLLKIKDSISIVYKKNGRNIYEVNFIFNATGTTKSFLLSRDAFLSLRYFNGLYSIQDIAELTKVKILVIRTLVKTLQKADLFSIKNKEVNYLPRFRDQLNFFSEFEMLHLSRFDMQHRIERATVAIIGLGGIGSWVAYTLSLVGINNFIFIDPDVIEETNLSRQCLYNKCDIGIPKVIAMQNHLKRINSKSSYTLYIKKFSDSLRCAKYIENAQLVINCADEPSVEKTNKIVSSICYPRQIPHILCGGYDGHLSFIGPTIIPPHSGCWFCYEAAIDNQQKLSKYKYLAITQTHFQGGGIAAICAITANIHALEAIKILSGCSLPLFLNRCAELDFQNFNMHFRNYFRRITCPVCGDKKGD